MSRLIDADILLERLEKKRKECNKEVKENENKGLELYIASHVEKAYYGLTLK